MKKFVFALAALMGLMVTVACAECTYFETNGDHDWIFGQKDAACETEGEAYRDCAECGLHEIQETIAAVGHKWEEKELISEATCVTDGEKLVACSVCAQEKLLILPATDHTFGEWTITEEASCSSEGSRQANCIMCDVFVTEVIEREEHAYGEWKISEEATDNSMGRRYRRCDECGATNEEDFYPDGSLYRGMPKSDEVKQMQLKLMQLGFLMDKADGLFGRNTEDAVKAFQEEAGFEVTGVAYPETLNAIFAVGHVASEIEIADGCGFELDEDGTVKILFCEKHYAMAEAAALKYGEAADKQLAIGELCGEWEAEVKRLYDEWLGEADVQIKEAITASREAFFEGARLYVELMDSFNSHENASLYIFKIYMDKCVDICGYLRAQE